MKRLMAIAFAAFALLGADGRDTAIYNGRLTSPMNANGMAITNAPTPVRDGDLVNKAYVDGISGVTPGTVTNIANARIDAKVAPWAMSGQPKPTTDLTGMTNFVRGVAQAGTNYTDTVASSKADLAVPSAARNFAALDAQGNLQDSLCSASSFRSSTWKPSWSQVTSKPSWIGDSKPTYTYDEVGAAQAVEGGYLPRILQSADPYTKIQYGGNGKLYYGLFSEEEEPIAYIAFDFASGRSVFDISESSSYAFRVDDDEYSESLLTPDGTPVMTVGQADFHIVTDSPVTSGQIGNFDLTGLTNKTVACSVSITSGNASDILIWTWGNTAECQMTFTLPSGFTLVGDSADTKASANKKCLFSLVKISNTEVIVSKKEYE